MAPEDVTASVANPPSPPNITFNAKGAACYIVQYNILENETRVLVAGNFLNFSKTHTIINVNLLEELLFWTDNRNQPRKINVQKAFNDSYQNSGINDPYYYNEDHISVAKFAPVEPFDFLDSSGNSTLISNSEEYLPAHIITTAATYDSTSGALDILGTYTTVNTSPDNPDLYGHATNGDLITIDNKNSYIALGVTTSAVLIETGLTIPNPPYKVKIQRRNPNYNNNYKGDARLLKNKFSKFSYRFKYDDGEYSLMAPFTQAAFVPKQFGYFINDDEKTTLQSGNVKFMENRVDQVKLNVALPYNGNQLKKE